MSCVLKFCVADQEEREYAMRNFRQGKKDVMVATDVASKGLDFPDIQHVINFDMPEDIENYGKMYTCMQPCRCFITVQCTAT